MITLLTDFGLDDGFVGTMKGVILRIHPGVSIVDIAHSVPPHDVDAGAFILYNSFRYFPEKTIHVAIVDPGVGGERKALAVDTEKYIFLAPDNGILKYIFHHEKYFKVFELTNADYFLQHVSRTFHGRDIFAPAAAHLSRGVNIDQLGPRTDIFYSGEVHLPEIHDTYIIGQVIYSDKFGNIITSIPGSLIQDRKICIVVGNHEICGLSRSYDDAVSSRPIALIGSSGYMEIAIYQESAKRVLKFEQGDEIFISIEK